MQASPLRYPGGKARVAPKIHEIINNISPRISTYYEPFCGGAGVALYLLLNDVVEYIAINDFDRAIYSFWRAVFFDTDKLVGAIEKAPLTIDEWRRQKSIYLNSSRYSVDYAFSTLFLNRSNRSGIISAGPIGGYKQEGLWRIDERFNKDKIINKIETVAKHKKRVKINNMDVRRYIRSQKFGKECFVFFDPPYVNNAMRLYKNSLLFEDHVEISRSIKGIDEASWIVTYDDTNIVRQLYADCYITTLQIQYCAANKRIANELLICNENTKNSMQSFVY